MAAWVARHLTQATLRELALQFGLSHPQSVSNVSRRVDHSLPKPPELPTEIEATKQRLLQ